jgi:hypothetical protein
MASVILNCDGVWSVLSAVCGGCKELLKRDMAARHHLIAYGVIITNPPRIPRVAIT